MANIKTKKQIVLEEQGIMIRVDKTLKEMISTEPISRFDVHYWHTKFDYLDYLFNQYNSKSLDQIEKKKCVISGDHIRSSRGEYKNYNLGTNIEYYETKGFLNTAYNYSQIKECSENAYKRLSYTKVFQNDILISCAGVGGVGLAKSCFISHKPRVKSCTGDVFIIRLKKIDPFFFFIFLNTNIGKDQIFRQQAGVGTVNINTDQVLKIRIPQLKKTVIKSIKKVYINTLKFHDKAMEAKKRGDEKGYKENITIAENMLRDLIKKTEQVIRGERDDVI